MPWEIKRTGSDLVLQEQRAVRQKECGWAWGSQQGRVGGEGGWSPFVPKYSLNSRLQVTGAMGLVFYFMFLIFFTFGYSGSLMQVFL